MTASEALVLRLERTFRAPRPVVYRALTDPAQLGRWWGPQGFIAPSVELDARVGGEYRIAMQPPDGDVFFLSGEFRQVEPPTRLAYTFRWDPPHPDDRETTVTLTLGDAGDETQLRLTQRGFATQERYALHKAGWSETFDRLEQFLVGAPRESGSGTD